MKSILLATVFAVGTIAAASAQSQMNQTPGNAQRDKSITAATHCLDKASNQPRLKQTTGSGSVAAGNATAGDKSAKSTGTSSQSPQSPGGAGGAMYSDLSAC
jgi:opacity protein-like surface antigen